MVIVHGYHFDIAEQYYPSEAFDMLHNIYAIDLIHVAGKYEKLYIKHKSEQCW